MALYNTKDPQLVLRAIHKMLEWISKGKSYKSFSYREGDDLCSYQTIIKYLNDEEFLQKYGMTFVPEHKDASFSEGYAIWEQIAEDSAKGLNKEANTASLQMIMRNKFGWDKKEEEKDSSKSDEAAKTIMDLFSVIGKVSQAPSPLPLEDKEHKEDQ